jgi:hypothetical protein
MPLFPEIPPAVLVQQKQGTAVTIWTVGAFCIFGWEWLLCLPQEYTRIWKKPMNASSVLYIANRYFGLLQFSFVVTLHTDIWSVDGCKHAYLWEPIGALIATALSQIILGSRVYAVFSKNKAIAFILGSILIIEVIIRGIATSVIAPPTLYAGPGATGPPCGALTGPSGWLIAFWIIPVLYDTIVFLLTAWKAYGYWKKEVHTPLFDIIWRDGLLYFFAIFSMNVINVIIFMTLSPTLRTVNLTATLILEVILSCRLLLNLRSAAQSSASKLTPAIIRWTDNSEIYKPSSIGDQGSMELPSMPGREPK